MLQEENGLRRGNIAVLLEELVLTSSLPSTIIHSTSVIIGLLGIIMILDTQNGQFSAGEVTLRVDKASDCWNRLLFTRTVAV
jgi:hypothetical protein